MQYVQKFSRIRTWFQHIPIHNCSILTLDRAVNQIFSAQDAPLKIRGSSHMFNGNCRHYKMIYVDVKVSVGVSTSGRKRAGSNEERPLGLRSTAASGWIPTGREAEEMLRRKHSMVWSREEVVMGQYEALFSSPFVHLSLSHTTEILTPFEKNKETFICKRKCHSLLWLHILWHLKNNGIMSQKSVWLPNILSEKNKKDGIFIDKSLIRRNYQFLKFIIGDFYDHVQWIRQWIDKDKSSQSIPTVQLQGRKVMLRIWYFSFWVFKSQSDTQCRYTLNSCNFRKHSALVNRWNFVSSW